MEEHDWLMDAAREEISRSISVDTLDNSFDNNDPAEGIAPTSKQSIFVDKSINKSSHAEKNRNSYFSLASNIVTKALSLDQTDKYSQSPPPLSLAKTFDTEQSSLSGDEDRDLEGNSTTSDFDAMLIQDFSRMSATAIETIFEEQQRTQEEIKHAEVQREQEEIDEALQFLHDGSESGTFFTNDGTLEWLETEVDHAEMISDIALEICNDDGSSQLFKVGNTRGDNTVAIASQPSLPATEEVEEEVGEKVPEDNSSKSEIEAKTDNSPPCKEENPASDSVVDAAEKDKEPPLTYEKDDEVIIQSVETENNPLPSPVVEEIEIVLIEKEISHPEGEEEKPIKAPPPSPVRKSKLVRQEQAKELNAPSIGTDQLPHDPTEENISVSRLLSFDEFPGEALVPDISYNPVSESSIVEDQTKESDLEEASNYVEDPISPLIIMPADKGPSRDVAVYEIETSEGAVSLPPTDKTEPPTDKTEPISTLDENGSSGTIPQIPPGLTEALSSMSLPMNEESAPMDELEFRINNINPKPQKVRSSFGWFKLFCLVAMVSIVGAIGHLSDPSFDPHLNEIQAVFDEGQCNAKKRREMKLDGFHAILW